MKILFVSHDANRAGAQLFLLSVMKYLKQKGAEMQLLLLDGGILEAEFAEICPYHYWTNNNSDKNGIKKAFSKFVKSQNEVDTTQQLLKSLQNFNFDYIYFSLNHNLYIYNYLDLQNRNNHYIIQ